MPGVTRRTFLETIAVSAALLDIAALRTVIASPKDGAIDVTIAEHDELKAPGGAIVLKVDDPSVDGGKIILARIDDTTFTAVAAKCQHKGCTIGYDADNKRFECPCHGSQYALDGTVIHGPSQHSVAKYAVAVANGVVTITYGAGNATPADSTKK